MEGSPPSERIDAVEATMGKLTLPSTTNTTGSFRPGWGGATGETIAATSIR